MRRHLLSSVIMLIGVTLVLGFGYPLLLAGLSALLFAHQADGSLIHRDGKLVGSSLLGQSFANSKGSPIPGYFQPRPSAAGTGYDAASSGATNLGPSNPLLIGFVAGVNTIGINGRPSRTDPFATQHDPACVPTDPKGVPVTSPAPGQRYARNPDGSYVCDPSTVPERAIAYRKFNRLPAGAPVPIDAVTASGSGLDPNISVQNALDQAQRVARARHFVCRWCGDRPRAPVHPRPPVGVPGRADGECARVESRAGPAPMSGQGWVQLLFIVAVTAVTAPLLGRYLAATFRGGRAPGDRVFLPAERLVYRALRIDPDSSWTWRGYALAVLAFGLASTVLLYLILRLQGVLPLNPNHAPGMPPLLSFNTAVSFITGTNWQVYEGETAASYLGQMAGLVVAQFTAAAIGLSVALAVIRGIAGSSRTIGNFWVDLTRSMVRVLVPLSILGTLVLVSQGAVQNFSGFRSAATLAGGRQNIPGGPVASMEVIKLLGTNGGSFYGAGGAHPFENPTSFTNMFDLLLVIVLPFAIVFMFGRLIGGPRQGYAIVAVMAVIFLGHTVISMQAEARGNHLLPATVSQTASSSNPGGNMEGKQTIFGPGGSALMTVGTMGTTAGATDSALDSYTPVGGAGAFVAILLGVISPGGDGGGLYSMLVLALLAVFVAGLMVGRTPKFLGKKIRATQMKLVVTYVLTIPVVILVLGSMSLVLRAGTGPILNPGMHGLTEVTYAYASSALNNGSAFAGLAANTPWYDTTLGLVMLVGRFVLIILALAISGSLAGARVHARTRATLDTSGPTFVVFLLGVILIVGGLIYFPMFILGPIGERIVG